MAISLVGVEHLVQLASDVSHSTGNVVSFGLHSLDVLRQITDVLVMHMVFPVEAFKLDLSHV